MLTDWDRDGIANNGYSDRLALNQSENCDADIGAIRTDLLNNGKVFPQTTYYRTF